METNRPDALAFRQIHLQPRQRQEEGEIISDEKILIINY
jgi:hypothetical protein